MAKNKQQELNYIDREALDEELHGAIADILSAEEEAKHIIAQAEASVKAIQLDGATRERDMKEQSNKLIATARDTALGEALKRAQEDGNKRIADAEKNGESLLKSKQKQIDARINELYASLKGGK